MTKEEYRELEILLGGLQVVGLAKRTEERLERSLQVIHRDKQLLISGVVGQSEQLKALLEKLLNENMCSVVGDELIEEALKGF